MGTDRSLEQLAQLVAERDGLPKRLADAIDAARDDGATWAQIGTVLGTTHAGAIQARGRYRKQGEQS